MAEMTFIAIAAITIASAFFVVFSKNLVYSAVALFFTLFGVAGLYVFLYADFIAATQVLVYVGGILVLIIFGVMLTNKISSTDLAHSSRGRFLAGLTAIVFFIMLVSTIFRTEWHSGKIQSAEHTVDIIGTMILTDYLLPFEIVSILLLAALVGAALLSRKSNG